jgi:hypothetical protein
MTRPPVVEAVDQLRDAIERLSNALASGDPRAVLACELPLVDAVRIVRSTRAPIPPADRDRVTALVSDARAALARCAKLGDTVVAIANAAIVPQSYGRMGATTPVLGRTLTSRT